MCVHLPEPSKFKKIEPTLALGERQCAALLLFWHFVELQFLQHFRGAMLASLDQPVML